MFELKLWHKLVLVFVGAVVAVGVGLFGYRYYTQPTVLTVATGSLDGQATEVMTALAARLAKNNSPVRLKVVPVNSMQEAAKDFSAGKVDMAVVRADIGDLAEVRTVITMAQGVVMIVVPPGSPVDSIDALKGKTVGIVGGTPNHAVVAALTKEYDLASKKVVFKDIALPDARKAIVAKEVSALLLVLPLSEKYLSIVRDTLQINPKAKPTLIAIDSASAIANVARAYESFDIPKGTLRGSPPIPDDDLTTLRVPVFLVAHKKLDNDTIADLTRGIMNARRELVGDFPVLAQLAAPSTEKDAFIPIHPGAAEFYGDTQQSFFDRYSNTLTYGPMMLGGVLSVLLASWKFLGLGQGNTRSPLDPFFALSRRIREAKSEDELVVLEEEIDTILKCGIAKTGSSDDSAADTSILILATNRLENAVHNRRMLLATSRASV